MIIFPGVGSYSSAMANLTSLGVLDSLRAHVLADKPYFGICLGMQTLFEYGDEGAEQDVDCDGTSTPTSTTIKGIGAIAGGVTRFTTTLSPVPSIGWNTTLSLRPASSCIVGRGHKYFVHSYRALPSPANAAWVHTTTRYGGETYVSSVSKGRVFACQFHPEKSGEAGLRVIDRYLRGVAMPTAAAAAGPPPAAPADGTRTEPQTERGHIEEMSKRLVVALDVRSNDEGDLVVTKGDQYDVREAGGSSSSEGKGSVRNLGKPLALAQKYAREGVDEIAFLNITSFRTNVIEDLPLVDLITEASRGVFVPLTVGGGIRDFEDGETGEVYKALDVAGRYFRAGADKVSIGSDHSKLSPGVASHFSCGINTRTDPFE